MYASEEKLKEVFKILFRGNDKLFSYLMDEKREKLRTNPEQVKKSICGLSSGEQILIKIALDFWNGSGKALWWEVFNKLDGRNTANVVEALVYLKKS